MSHMNVNIKLIFIHVFMITIINGDYYHLDTLLLLIIITMFLYDTVTTIYSFNKYKKIKLY